MLHYGFIALASQITNSPTADRWHCPWKIPDKLTKTVNFQKIYEISTHLQHV